MKIKELTLHTNQLQETCRFYQEVMEFSLIEKTEQEVSFQVGSSILRFVQSEEESPQYHFALLVPNNRLFNVELWLLYRVVMIPNEEGHVTIDFEDWNASSIYFYDNNRNIVEFITRYDLKKNSNRQFTPKLISCINEVGIGTSTPRVAAEFLNKSLGVEYFAKGPNRDDFIAMGDENGLFVVSSTDRHWYPTDYKAGEFPIRVKFEVNGRELEYIVDSGPNLQIYYDAPEYCYYFFDLVLTGDLLAELEKNRDLTIAVIKSIPEDKANFAYAKGKWTVKEVLRHIIECERVYSYRAMRFSRFDKMPLPGFDENQYISNVKDMSYTLEDLLEEYTHLRNATIALYKNMTPEMLDFRGTANGEVFTARSLGFMAVGHNVHHLKVLQKKYLK